MRGLKTRGFALSSGAIPVIISFVVWMRQTLKENHLLWEMRKIDIFSHPSTRTTKWSPIRLILVTYQPETSWVISTWAKHKPETLTEGPQTVIVVFAMRSEQSERASKWMSAAERASKVSRAKWAVRSKQLSERCEQTSKRTSEWPSTYMWTFIILAHSGM